MHEMIPHARITSAIERIKRNEIDSLAQYRSDGQGLLLRLRSTEQPSCDLRRVERSRHAVKRIEILRPLRDHVCVEFPECTHEHLIEQALRRKPTLVNAKLNHRLLKTSDQLRTCHEVFVCDVTIRETSILAIANGILAKVR